MDFFPVIPTAYELVITGIAILICVITDIRSGYVCPWVCLALAVAAAFEPGKDFVMSLISAGICFSVLFIIARFGRGGDGDALLNGAVGFTLPLMYMLYMFLITSIIYAVVLAGYIIKTRGNGTSGMEKTLPYAPFVLAGWSVMLILYLTGVLV